MERYDLIAVGESLVDVLVETDGTALEIAGNAGGAPANVLSLAVRFGLSTALVARVGDDAFGRYLTVQMENLGIGTAHISRDADRPTTLAVVSLSPEGERSFRFYRGGTADAALSPEHLPLEAIRRARMLHFGSVSLSVEPSRGACVAAVAEARKHAAPVSFDPNLRLSLWNHPEEARRWILWGLEQADFIKLSEEELAFLTGESDVAAGMEAILRHCSPGLLVVTCGVAGACGHSGEHTVICPAFARKAVDTTGAGDAFWGACLIKLLQREVPSRTLSREELQDLLRFGAAAGALAVEGPGASPPELTAEAVWALANSR